MKTIVVALSAVLSISGFAQDTVFVSDQGGSRKIVRIHFPSGTVINTFGAGTYGQDMAQDAAGNLLVCDQLAGQVKKFNPQTGAFLGVVCSGIVSDYFGLALMPDGTILVTGAFNAGVLKFDPNSGLFLGYFVAPGTSGLSSTRGMRFGPDGDLYVCAGSNRLYRFNGTTGAFVRFIQFPAGADRCAFGPDGRVYATHEASTIHVADPNTGQYQGIFVNSAQGLGAARGIEFGSDGYLYAANSNNSVITRIDGTTGLFHSIFFSGAPVGQCSSMLFGRSTRMVTGRLRLRHREEFAPSIGSVQMEFRKPDSLIAVETKTVAIGPNEEFAVVAPYPHGPYDISIKVSHWLRRTITVDTSGGDVSGALLTCTNGDADLDNEVGPGDFGAVSAAFGTVVGDALYNPNADLDEDGEVGPVDFGILSAYFGSTGDM